jgi:carotenoid 1,2-hydratase
MAVPRGRRDPSRGGGANGGAVGTTGGGESARGPGFDRTLTPGGYAWWYVDALSDDGRHALTIIAFIGSVFSPYYAAARRRGAGDPTNHCAINVAIYGEDRKRWSMTERGSRQLARERDRLVIGPSRLDWDGSRLTIQIDEMAAPWPARIRGKVHLHAKSLFDRALSLDRAGRHSWTALAPCARMEVDLEHPRLRWHGHGYWDTNTGSEPLELGFTRWDWSRTTLRDGSTAVLYDASRRDGGNWSAGLRFDRSGRVEEFEAPQRARLPVTGWRIERGTRSEDARATGVRRTLEDTPFYARSLVSAKLLGEPVTGVHESLSLERFSRRWVQALLPFRMPRRS